MAVTALTLEEAMEQYGSSILFVAIIIMLGFYFRVVPALVTFSPVFVAGKQKIKCSSHLEMFRNSTDQCYVTWNDSTNANQVRVYE